MAYIITFVLIVLALYWYFGIAEKYHLMAGVNNRSSHKKPVITGAGFIIFLSFVCFFVYSLIIGAKIPWLFLIGLTILSVVSFLDDLYDLWFLIRLVIQFFAAGLLILQLTIDIPELTPQPSVSQWLAAVTVLFITVGFINMYNFMDGINGMLGWISLSPLVCFWIINQTIIPFIDPAIIYYFAIPMAVFMFLNYRNEPKCFSGDVGSIASGFILVYMMALLIIKTGNVAFLLMFSTVFIEAGLTIIQRLFAGENIFKPHRIHLFQLYCNEFYKSHKQVSAIYGGIQLGFGLVLIALNYYSVSVLVQNVILWTIFAALSLWYLILKRRKLGGHLLDYKKVNSN